MSDGQEISERYEVTHDDAVASRLSSEELVREGGELLPDKEVLSILDLFVNIDLALDLAAPIDLAVAANANVAAPIDAAATANVLTVGSTATALADQGAMVTQYISGEANAIAPQDVVLDQSNDVVDAGSSEGDAASSDSIVGGDAAGATSEPEDPGTSVGDTAGTVGEATGESTTEVVDGTTAGSLLEGPLLNVNVDASIDADLAAPVAGAVAANANVAAPIDAAVAANIGTVDSSSIAVADQDVIISQTLDEVEANAVADQDAEVTQ